MRGILILQDVHSTEAYVEGAPINLGRRRRKSRHVRDTLPTTASLGRTYATGNVSGFAAIQSDDIQAEYQCVKDAMVRQKLPKDLKFGGSIKGIKTQNKDTARAYINSAKYIETCIKLVSSIQASRNVRENNPYEMIDDVLVCFNRSYECTFKKSTAYWSVGGNYGSRTQQIFRSIHTNPTQFTPEVVEQLRTSVALAAIPPEVSTGDRQPNRQFRPFQHGNFRGRGRGFQQRDNSQQPFDNPGFRSRTVPTERTMED